MPFPNPRRRCRRSRHTRSRHSDRQIVLGIACLGTVLPGKLVFGLVYPDVILLGRVCPGNGIVFLALACFVVFPIVGFLVIVLAVKVTGVTGVTIVSSWSSGRVKLVPNRSGDIPQGPGLDCQAHTAASQLRGSGKSNMLLAVSCRSVGSSLVGLLARPLTVSGESPPLALWWDWFLTVGRGYLGSGPGRELAWRAWHLGQSVMANCRATRSEDVEVEGTVCSEETLMNR